MRRNPAIILMLTIAVMLAGVTAQARAGQSDRALLRVVLHSNADLEELKASGIPVYAQLSGTDGSVLLVGAGASQAGALLARALDVQTLDTDMDAKQYYVAYHLPGLNRVNLESFGKVLYEDELYSIMRMSPEEAGRLAEAGAELRAVTLDPKPVIFSPPVQFAPTSITPDPRIQQMINQVDSATVYQYTGDLSGEWPVTVGGSPYIIATRHTYSGTPIRRATQYAGEHLEVLGLDVEYHEWDNPNYPNVIGELPGRGSPDSIVIICGHLDDMPSGSTAPGADDNASGSTAVLVAADIMSQYDWRYTLRFALWTGEEQGLLGSHYYAERCYSLGEPVVGVLNLDMIAYNSIGSGTDIDLHANSGIPETLELAQLFADAVAAYGLDLVCQIIPNGIGASDHASFTDYGYSAILGIEDMADFNPRYHTTGDQLQYFDMDYYVDFVKASVATCAHMAGVYTEEPTVPSMTVPVFLLLALLLATLGHRAMGNP